MSMLSDRDVVCNMLDAANAWESLSKLFETLNRSREEKLRLDQTEREMFGCLMELGLRLLKSYVQSAGDGDQGECIGHSKHGEAAYCHHPQGSVQAEKYVNKYLRRILDGKVEGVIRSLKGQLPKLTSNKAKEMTKAINYIERNRKHMRYDEYLSNGYPIGSGVVEGACRHVVKDRMERAGMRWEIEGAQSVLALRTTYLNNNWDKLIIQRIKNEQKALYSLAA